VEVAREALGDQSEPEWLSEAARLRLAARRAARDAFCRAVLEEAGEA
jgi:hypothetical protein